MINYITNIEDIIAHVIYTLRAIDTERMTKEMAVTISAMMRQRINEEGKSASGSLIGSYSKEYMKVRTGNYGNSGRTSRGKNAGKPKDAGVYTRGANKGAQRPKYNRSASTDVVLSLTREMENDFGCFRTDTGSWGIGFIRNPRRGKITHVGIVDHAAEMYGKQIYALSADERTTVDLISLRYIKEAFKW